MRFVYEPGVKNIVILGDSHAVDALNALHSVSPNSNYIVSDAGGCPPLAGEDYQILTPQAPDRVGCIKLNDARFNGDLLVKADLVVINVYFGARGGGWWYKPENLERAIKDIQRKTSVPIWVFGNYITMKDDLPKLILRHPQDFLDPSVINEKWVGSAFMYESELEELSVKLGFVFISKKALLCPAGEVEHCPIALGDGKLFTYDSHHLSVSAAELLGKRLEQTYPQLFDVL